MAAQAQADSTLNTPIRWSQIYDFISYIHHGFWVECIFFGILREVVKVSQNWFEEKAYVQNIVENHHVKYVNMSIVIFQIFEWQKPESNPLKVLSYSHLGGVDCFTQKSVVPPVGCVKELARERLKNPSLTRHSPFFLLWVFR